LRAVATSVTWQLALEGRVGEMLGVAGIPFHLELVAA
jgi:hypothetical protein